MIAFKKIIFNKAQIKILENWANELYPLEAPAILLGIIDEENKVGIVSDIYPLENTAQSEVRFEIDPVEQYKIYEIAKENNKMIIGIFHSHPMAPVPSGIDLPFLKLHQNI